MSDSRSVLASFPYVLQHPLVPDSARLTAKQGSFNFVAYAHQRFSSNSEALEHVFWVRLLTPPPPLRRCNSFISRILPLRLLQTTGSGSVATASRKTGALLLRTPSSDRCHGKNSTPPWRSLSSPTSSSLEFFSDILLCISRVISDWERVVASLDF